MIYKFYIYKEVFSYLQNHIIYYLYNIQANTFIYGPKTTHFVYCPNKLPLIAVKKNRPKCMQHISNPTPIHSHNKQII